jgi:hypothetical protein
MLPCIGVSYFAALSIISAPSPLERQQKLFTLLDGGVLYHNVAMSLVEFLSLSML